MQEHIMTKRESINLDLNISTKPLLNKNYLNICLVKTKIKYTVTVKYGTWQMD